MTANYSYTAFTKSNCRLRANCDLPEISPAESLTFTHSFEISSFGVEETLRIFRFLANPSSITVGRGSKLFVCLRRCLKSREFVWVLILSWSEKHLCKIVALYVQLSCETSIVLYQPDKAQLGILTRLIVFLLS